ncbi:MAG TPA: hypothetical protein DIW81_00575 [Planctomycetaceae bacterium]|nr:hypothetical protein [Rubinisphaera sp.]HCS50078.1 hypothetical protein [Planctomycetaceae bacterium]
MNEQILSFFPKTETHGTICSTVLHSRPRLGATLRIRTFECRDRFTFLDIQSILLFANLEHFQNELQRSAGAKTATCCLLMLRRLK